MTHPTKLARRLKIEAPLLLLPLAGCYYYPAPYYGGGYYGGGYDGGGYGGYYGRPYSYCYVRPYACYGQPYGHGYGYAQPYGYYRPYGYGYGY